ncbi:MAG: hypothetical protein Q8M22_04240 [Actinomycetota bacterium]|nr:hypothetical protein [Actinomycetota bacterium]
MSAVTSVGHLARRFFTSLSRRPPSAADTSWALAQLLPGESALWQSMPVQDRRHSLLVARRFVADGPAPERAEVAGALLHDVGKREAGLGTFSRVVATIVGPRTARFRAYHDHEAIGARLAADAGSDPVTVELIRGRGPAADRLRTADHV